MIIRPKKIEELFRFLKKNHCYNKKIQEGFIEEWLSSYNTNDKRALLILTRIVNSQSQPRLEPLADFFASIQKNKPLNSFLDFINFLQINSCDRNGLFNKLQNQPGWGPKTAALFIRNLALIEAEPRLNGRFWNDINVLGSQIIKLPVDKVILSVFSTLQDNDTGPLDTFIKINKHLLETRKYKNNEMLIWDDLWFWGFITQKSKIGEAKRTHEWNVAKYWSIFTAPKDQESIQKIECLANEFLQIIN